MVFFYKKKKKKNFGKSVFGNRGGRVFFFYFLFLFFFCFLSLVTPLRQSTSTYDMSKLWKWSKKREMGGFVIDETLAAHWQTWSQLSRSPSLTSSFTTTKNIFGREVSRLVEWVCKIKTKN
jgi:hypothetical protein